MVRNEKAVEAREAAQPAGVRDKRAPALVRGSSAVKWGRVMHKVAIGMPVWNGEQFVSEAIESILGQTYGDLELVISDNASTDGTAEICSNYAKQDRRVRYIRQEKNIGAAPNHNEVFRRSSGQYFKWACHADVLAREFIEECVRESLNKG